MSISYREGAFYIINSDVTLISHFVRQTGKIVTYLLYWYCEVSFLLVVGCTNRNGKEKALSFYLIPNVSFVRAS